MKNFARLALAVMASLSLSYVFSIFQLPEMFQFGI